MRFSDPIYPITDVRLSGLSHTEQVRRLVETGVALIQLREKLMSPRAFAEDARVAIEIARNAGVKIVINDRVDIALVLGADGVHLGQTDLPPKQARRLLGQDAIIGYSTHTVSQAADAAREPIDYIAAGPVFATSSKQDPDAVIGIEALSEIRGIIDKLPLVAIGGIGQANIGTVARTGSDAAAMIGAVCAGREDIESDVRLLREEWNNNVVKQC